MITEINPQYDEMLFINFDDSTPIYYALYCKRRNVVMDDMEVAEDTCLIAYSNESHAEVAKHRSKLIKDGYYRPTDIYIKEFPNWSLRNKRKKRTAMNGKGLPSTM